ncbi:MAG: hypothetical protein WBH08_10755 [Methanothrix sp.]
MQFFYRHVIPDDEADICAESGQGLVNDLLVGLAGRSPVINYYYLLCIWMQFEHKRDCTWQIEGLHYAREVLPSRQHPVFEEVNSAKDNRSAGKQLVFVVEQELECIIVRTDDDIIVATFIFIFI